MLARGNPDRRARQGPKGPTGPQDHGFGRALQTQGYLFSSGRDGAQLRRALGGAAERPGLTRTNRSEQRPGGFLDQTNQPQGGLPRPKAGGFVRLLGLGSRVFAWELGLLNKGCWPRANHYTIITLITSTNETGRAGFLRV